MNIETETLNDDLTQIWRTARKAMNSADELWNIFVNLVEQETIDYYVAKTLRQSIKTEIKDAVEFADKLSELCHTLNRKLNEEENDV